MPTADDKVNDCGKCRRSFDVIGLGAALQYVRLSSESNMFSSSNGFSPVFNHAHHSAFPPQNLRLGQEFSSSPLSSGSTMPLLPDPRDPFTDTTSRIPQPVFNQFQQVHFLFMIFVLTNPF
jgi:hypothetical protein